MKKYKRIKNDDPSRTVSRSPHPNQQGNTKNHTNTEKYKRSKNDDPSRIVSFFPHQNQQENIKKHLNTEKDKRSKNDDPRRMVSRSPHQNQDQVPAPSKITNSEYGKKRPLSEQTEDVKNYIQNMFTKNDPKKV